MKDTTIPWAVTGQSPFSSDSGSAGVMARVADFTTRVIGPRPLACRAEPPAGTPKERNGGPAAQGPSTLGFAPGNLGMIPSSDVARTPRSGRTLARFLEPLDSSAGSAHLVRQSGLLFDSDGESHELPRYQFTGPRGGGDAVRIGIFATVHGDEPESGLGLLRFLQELVQRPDAAEGFVINAYPMCNPTGYLGATRHARSGKDLNREFWRDSREPEVRLLEAELRRHQFHGIVSLHCDDTSHGLYGFLSGRNSGAVLSASLLEPALRAAEEFLPRNCDSRIDGFHARGGVLSTCYDGVLRAPDDVRPPPFEITFETPQHAAAVRQVEAFNAALLTILAEFRYLQAIGQNI
ncbi:MAG: succinylglutamate desuccinylase/aspartoacylase family protein [Verrucomicrobia bacterium]|nr:succinylglutamate desuccinylase/aspartoacylase family protein [Verrucomicrobiota bacterium]